MNRVRICGEITNRHDRTIEMSDEEFKKFRDELDRLKKQEADPDALTNGINDFLGENFGDTDPLDWAYNEWSADLVGDDGKIIESLDTY